MLLLFTVLALLAIAATYIALRVLRVGILPSAAVAAALIGQVAHGAPTASFGTLLSLCVMAAVLLLLSVSSIVEHFTPRRP